MKLEINNVTKSYGERQVLSGVTLCAEAGRPLGLLGRNGAGKTTLMRIIMNILHPDSGTLLLDGRPVCECTRRIGYLPEERGLYARSSVEEQLVYIGMLGGLSRAAAQESCRRWLGRLGVEKYRRALVQTLSKGNQQRVQLAMALINDPDAVILDEPFSGLDPVGARELREVIEELAGSGKVVIVSSHQMSAVESVCQSVVMLRQGVVVLDSTVARLRDMGKKSLVRLHTDNDARALSLAASFGAARQETDCISLALAEGQSGRSLLGRLMEDGLEIRLFESGAVSLEEMFVSLCGETAGEVGEVSADA